MTEHRIIIVGRREDPSVQLLVERWQAKGARLLTVAGVLVRGWRHDPADPEHDVAVVDDQVWPASTITGVVTRLGWVTPADLGPIRELDRAYVAAETNGFLLSWLSSLRCPVIDRPIAGYSYGSIWRPQTWTRLAYRLGIPIEPIETHTGSEARASSPDATVFIAGHEVFGDIRDPTLVAYARQLATASRTALLRVDFSSGPHGARFRRAQCSFELETSHADALLRFMLEAADTDQPTQLRRVAT